MSESNSTNCSADALDELATVSRRRSLLGLAGLIALPLNSASAAEPSSGRSVRLAQPTVLSELNTQAKIALELEGELHLKQSEPEAVDSVKTVELKGKSTLEYLERNAYVESKLVASGRKYIEAKTENWIAGSRSSETLRDRCKETVQLKHDGVWQQYSPDHSLSMREVNLIQAPLNSAALELLLPKQPAKPDDHWKLSASDAAELFNLEAVHKSSVEARIAKVENGKATIEIAGELDGTANSVPTKLDIKGNFHASLGSKCAIVTWVGLVIKEDREISNAEPGFLITARVRLIRAETSVESAMAVDQLRELAATEDEGRWLVETHTMRGHCKMLADRRWKKYTDGGEESVLRLIENDLVIAQCNMTRLADLNEGVQLTIEGLQADIRKSLGDRFGSFLDVSEKAISNSHRLIRCTVTGTAEEVPIQWIYAHISNDAGQRVLLLYTMGGNVTDRFAGADEQMTASFEMQSFATSDESAAPSPAPRLTANPDQTAR